MSSNDSFMDYQNSVKDKSGVLQYHQMEMIFDKTFSNQFEPDVSIINSNESMDYNFELNSTESRISQSIDSDSDTINYNQSSRIETSHNRIEHSSVDWNNTTIIHHSNRQSKSTNNISEVIVNVPSRSIRRDFLSWELKFTPNDKVNDNNSIREIKSYYNFSNTFEHLNLEKTLLKTVYSFTVNSQLYKDDILTHIKKTTNENNFQQSYYLNVLNNNDCNDQSNEILDIERNEISETNYRNQKQTDELNIMHLNQQDVEISYQIHCSVTSEFENPSNSHSHSNIFDSLKAMPTNTIRNSKSYDYINKLDISMINTFKFQNDKKEYSSKKIRQSKRIQLKNNYKEILDDMQIPEVNYNQIADEIYKEHKTQLLEARINDKEFNKKLKFINFTLVNENIYRPNKKSLKLYPSSEIAALRKLKQKVLSDDVNDYCECTLSKENIIEGNIGCDDRCLNRILKVECGSDCSLKQYCTNKQFQNKQFKNINIIKTKNKGYGICAAEDIPMGVLISEFVGEIIDHNEMCDRLKIDKYKNLNYMIQLNSDEIIDATSKGNLTRFINHSCDPNTVGEKWHVLGQSRIGFFSIRHIKKGEEITFDYSFQIFGKKAQICYCGSLKCRGYIGKVSQNTDRISSDDSDSVTNYCFASILKENQRKKRVYKKKTEHNDENKLRELSRQLMEIAKLKTGLKSDQEMATLNLNRLMVNVTDSVSRLHVLKFIREHDMNKLFKNFSGLSIIHNWMISNENKSIKLMILEILTELPIVSRNIITKSKVLDVVGEWAKIPQNLKTKIGSLKYTNPQKHEQEIDNLLSKNIKNYETNNVLVEKARVLWKKWILLKMVFKIPKKTDQYKLTEKFNLKKIRQDFYSSLMDIPTLDRTMFRISNNYDNKVQNQQIMSLKHVNPRNLCEVKVEEDRKLLFRKRMIDDFYIRHDRTVKKIPDQNFVQYQKSLHFSNNDNSKLNRNNAITEQGFLKTTHTGQNSIVTNNKYNSHLNCISPQNLHQPSIIFPQYSHTPLRQSEKCTTSINKHTHQNIKPCNLSPTELLIKKAETNVFNLINESLRKHNSSENKNVDRDHEYINKSCSRTVQSGVDLLARIKVISNSFKNQPSKLLKIKHLKEKKTNLKKTLSSDVMLKSVCNKNKKLIFINEQAGVTSNTLSEDLLITPKTINLSKKNKFSIAILNSLLKKVILEKKNLVPTKFVIKELNSNVISCLKINKEIELYKNLIPTIIKKVVGHGKALNGFVTVIKRQWGMKLKDLNRIYYKNPATKLIIMNKEVSLHRRALKNCLVQNIESTLMQKSNSVEDYIKRLQEKKVLLKIDSKKPSISPHSEVQKMNLIQKSMKQKSRMMYHHSLEIPNEYITLKQLQNQRIHKIPESMLYLPVYILKRIPDSKDEINKLMNYYGTMAKIIVKKLGPYTKNVCQQGRIRNQEDFKYIARKLNEHMLFNKLKFFKKIDKLKISDHTEDKVVELISKYMSQFGDVYKPSVKTKHNI